MRAGGVVVMSLKGRSTWEVRQKDGAGSGKKAFQVRCCLCCGGHPCRSRFPRHPGQFALPCSRPQLRAPSVVGLTDFQSLPSTAQDAEGGGDEAMKGGREGGREGGRDGWWLVGGGWWLVVGGGWW